MPLQDLTAPPTAPQRDDPPDVFIERADAFVAWFATFVTQMQTLTAQLEASAALINAAPAYADPLLMAIAGSSLTPAADKLPYLTGSNSAALASLSAFARTLIDDADAAAMRGTLGLGALALLASINDANWSGADLTIANGGTGASSASAARSNLGAAASGSNSDITALAGLTTALSIAQGGTGANTGGGALAALGIAVTDNANGTALAIPIGSETYYFQMTKLGSTDGSEATQSLTWPITFPTACLRWGVSTHLASASDTSDLWYQSVGTPTTSSITVQNQKAAGGSITPGVAPSAWGFGH